MDPIQARLISQSGNRAQVTVVVGEGRERHSVTRHVRMINGKWMGHNPDKSAVVRLDQAEEHLKYVGKRHSTINPLGQIGLPELETILRRIARYKQKAQGVPSGFFDLVGNMLVSEEAVKAETVKAAIEAKVLEAAAALEKAAKTVREIGVSREVEFTLSH